MVSEFHQDNLLGRIMLLWPIWHILVARSRRIAGACLLAAMTHSLSGCFVSKEAVFDAGDAVAPFAVGRYSVENFNKGTWETAGTWTLKLTGNTYSSEDTPRGRVEF